MNLLFFFFFSLVDLAAFLWQFLFLRTSCQSKNAHSFCNSIFPLKTCLLAKLGLEQEIIQRSLF